MKKVIKVVLFAMLSAPLPASGPYTPVRVDPSRDDMYDTGKALFLGDIKIGDGNSCASCHSKHASLNKKRLKAVKFALESKVNECVQEPDRVHGKVDDKQREALVYYIAKRYGI